MDNVQSKVAIDTKVSPSRIRKIYYQEKIETAIRKVVRTLLRVLKILCIIALVFVPSYLTVRIAQDTSRQKMELRSKAAATEANFVLLPAKVSQQKGESFELAVKVVGVENKKIGFIKATISFDPTHLQVRKIALTGHSEQMNILKNTPADQANTNGEIMLVLGTANLDQEIPQSVNLPNLTFEIVETGKSEISIDLRKSQVVYSDGLVAEPKSEGTVSVDSLVATPTPTTKPVATVVPTVTITATTVITVTIAPSAAPTATTPIVPVPTSTITIAPQAQPSPSIAAVTPST